MLTVSVGAPWFIALLVASPLLLATKGVLRKSIFCLLSLAVWGVSCQSVAQAAVMAGFVALPFLYAKLGRGKWPKWPVLAVLVAAFVYLNQYVWILHAVHIQTLLAFRLLGLSYVLFRVIDFLFQESYLREQGLRYDLVDYLNYLFSFYTIAAGPIARFEDFLRTFRNPAPELGYHDLLKQLHRAANGLIKVVVISGFCAGMASDGYDAMARGDNVLLSFATLAFFNTLFIYFNFSGYCDVVIAFARLAGLVLPENFNKPYLSRNIADFWNRQHITLSEWIRDYVYSPLFKKAISGPFRKRIKTAQYLALFVTFLLAGIWHGASVNFVLYGVLQGIGVVLSTIYRERLQKKMGKAKFKEYSARPVVIWSERAVTFLYICVSFSFIGYDIVGLLG